MSTSIRESLTVGSVKTQTMHNSSRIITAMVVAASNGRSVLSRDDTAYAK